MTISNFRNSEPLYIIIVRESNAQDLLKNWAKSANVQVTIETNRMKLFESRTLGSFQITWPHSWDNVTIWDCWLRRHIYYQ